MRSSSTGRTSGRNRHRLVRHSRGVGSVQCSSRQVTRNRQTVSCKPPGMRALDTRLRVDISPKWTGDSAIVDRRVPEPSIGPHQYSRRPASVPSTSSTGDASVPNSRHADNRGPRLVGAFVPGIEDFGPEQAVSPGLALPRTGSGLGCLGHKGGAAPVASWHRTRGSRRPQQRSASRASPQRRQPQDTSRLHRLHSGTAPPWRSDQRRYGSHRGD